MAVRGEDAGHFAQCSAPIFHVAQTEGNCHAIEGGIGKRQSHRISHDGSLHALFLRQLQHFSQNINGDDFCIRRFLPHCDRKISCPGGEIDNVFGRPPCDDLRSMTSPVKIRAATQHMIC